MILSVSQLKAEHSKLLAKIEAVLTAEATSAGEAGVKHVKSHPKFKPRTGKLQNSTRARVVKLRNGRRVVLRNGRRYANAIDQGARPHPIVARRRKFLRFRGRDGKWVFRRRVFHPGNRPYRFLWKATHAAFRIFGQNLRVALVRAVR